MTVRVELVVGRYRPDRDGVSAYVERLTSALPDVGVHATVTEWPGLRRWRPRGDADLVHVQFAPSAYGYSGGVGLLPVRARVPVVTTLHEYGWWRWQPFLERVPSRLRRPIEAAWSGTSQLAERTGRWDRESLLLAPASRAVIVTGAGHAETVERRLGRRPAVVPIGANIERTYGGDRSSARREAGLPAEVPVLAFFGFVHPVKGLRYLLDAVAELRAASYPALRLAVVGGWRSLAWPDEEADEFVAGLRQQAEGAGLAEVVTFTGFVSEEDASRWLTAADLAVLPFTHGVTAKSGSLLTCWAHRLPVVAVEPPEGADPDVSGAVAPASRRDVPTLRAAVAGLLADPERRHELVEAGCDRMTGRSWPAVATAHRRLYDQVLGR